MLPDRGAGFVPEGEIWDQVGVPDRESAQTSLYRW